MSLPEVIGKPESKNRRINMFFRVKTSKNIRELIKESNRILKEGNAKVFKKFTLSKHIKKIGCIYGSCVKFSNLEHCKRILSMRTEQNEKFFELRKEKVCENGHGSMCVVVHAIQSKRDQVDRIIKRMLQKKTLTHVSFRTSKTQERKCMLHKNYSLNGQAKHEILNNVNIDENVTC